MNIDGKIIGDSKFSSVLTSSSLTGTGITNSKGENLGDLKDLMIDLRSGSIAYAVVSFGGFLGMGNKLFAMPWEAFTVDEKNEKLIVNIDKKVLEDAPGFDKDNWPKNPDRDFISKVHTHYGYKPYWDRDYSSAREAGTDANPSVRTGYANSGL
jgi:sporulation protein YlmC with PRC-barrel domain